MALEWALADVIIIVSLTILFLSFFLFFSVRISTRSGAQKISECASLTASGLKWMNEWRNDFWMNALSGKHLSFPTHPFPWSNNLILENQETVIIKFHLLHSGPHRPRSAAWQCTVYQKTAMAAGISLCCVEPVRLNRKATSIAPSDHGDWDGQNVETAYVFRSQEEIKPAESWASSLKAPLLTRSLSSNW